MIRRVMIFFFILPFTLLGEQSFEEMMRALDSAAQIDRELHECFPQTFNHLLSSGYIMTHSARMSCGGDLGFGVAHVPPYLNWNVRVQPFSRLELSGNYRVFRGCEDPVLGPYGFGDYADRGANFACALFTPEESLYLLPGLSFGIDDFMGTKKFTTYYIVATQVMREWGLEASVGWGAGQYTKGPSRGFFGGFNWFPLWHCSNKWIRGIGVTGEFDPTNYHKNPHPEGRVSHSPVNVGAKYVFSDFLELSASYIRGDAFAASGSVHYNWGKSLGFIPKIGDPLPYTAPLNTEPLGCYRPQQLMIQEINYALEGQGFQLTKAWITQCAEKQTLWLRLMNCRYRQENTTRLRLQNLLATLTPENITDVVVIVEAFGLSCQQYTYNREWLVRYATRCMSPYEFDILTPRMEACTPVGEMIFQRRYELWRSQLSPRFETFLGNARGKFKYDLGLKWSLEGFLPYRLFYEFQVSYTALSTLKGLADFDFFHPSQLPNVATDYINYRQQSAYTWDMLYLQRSWNFGRGCFGRLAGGYFQVNYAGVGGELLWYPARSCFAIGLEGAVVKKRRYAGFGFQSTLRQFEGETPVFHHYSTLQQYFLDFYFDFPAYCFFSKLSVGQFLARDVGVRLEATRYFENGVRISGWMAFTNASDMMHGQRYFNRGIALEIPFDLFYTCSNRRVWNYGMAAWLRDAGYSIPTGKSLFYILNRERRW